MKYQVYLALVGTAAAEDFKCKTTKDCPQGIEGFCGQATGCTDAAKNMPDRLCGREEDVVKVMQWTDSTIIANGYQGCTFDYGLWGVGGVSLECTKVADCPKGYGKGYCAKIAGCVIASANSDGYCIQKSAKDDFLESVGFTDALKKRVGLEGCTFTWGELGDPAKEIKDKDGFPICSVTEDCPKGKAGFCGFVSGCTTATSNWVNRRCVSEEKANLAMGWDDAAKKSAGYEGCKIDYGLWGVGGMDLTCTKVSDCPKGKGKGYCAKVEGCETTSANSTGYCILSTMKKEYIDKWDDAKKANFGLKGCTFTFGEEGDPAKEVPEWAKDEKKTDDDDGSMAKLSAAAAIVAGAILMQ